MDDASSVKYYDNYADHLSSRGVTSGETPELTYLRREKVTAYRFKIIDKYLDKRSSVLEIGGGCGNFIGKLHESGKIQKAALLESCKQHLEFAERKFGISCYSSIDQISGMTFDRIFMFHTLEHIRTPHKFLKTIRRILKPGGLIVIEVPCSADPLLRIYNCSKYKDFYFQPMHNFVYAEKSLRLLFSRNNFIPENFRYVQRYPLSNHISWLSKGKPGIMPEISEIITPIIDEQYILTLEKIKSTDTIFATFKSKQNIL